MGRLSRKVVIAKEGIVLDDSLIRWNRIGEITISKNVIVLHDSAGIPVAVLPHTPDVEEILRERTEKQNV